MLRWSLMLLLAALLGGCGYREFQQLDAERQSAWASLQPLHQQRTALSLNLLNSTRALPTAQTAWLTRLARAREQAFALPPSDNPEDAALMQRHIAAQTELSAALEPLLALARQQPGLLPMAQQFDGLANRIRVQQQRHLLATQRHNQLLREFPSSVMGRLQGRALWPEGL